MTPHNVWNQLHARTGHFRGNVARLAIRLEAIMASAIFVEIRARIPMFTTWAEFPSKRNTRFFGKKLVNFSHSLSCLFGSFCPQFGGPPVTDYIRESWATCPTSLFGHIRKIFFLDSLKKVVGIYTQFIVAFVTDRISRLNFSIDRSPHSTMSISIFSIKVSIPVSRSPNCALPLPTSIRQNLNMRFQSVKKFLIFHNLILTHFGSVVKILPREGNNAD